MKKSKKVQSLILTTILSLALFACSSGGSSDGKMNGKGEDKMNGEDKTNGEDKMNGEDKTNGDGKIKDAMNDLPVINEFLGSGLTKAEIKAYKLVFNNPV